MGGRFTHEEDLFIISEWRKGTLIQRISLELDRRRSSVSDRIAQFKRDGVLLERVRYKNKLDVHLRLPPDLHQRLQSHALSRGRTFNKFIESILLTWTG